MSNRTAAVIKPPQIHNAQTLQSLLLLPQKVKAKIHYLKPQPNENSNGKASPSLSFILLTAKYEASTPQHGWVAASLPLPGSSQHHGQHLCSPFNPTSHPPVNQEPEWHVKARRSGISQADVTGLCCRGLPDDLRDQSQVKNGREEGKTTFLASPGCQFSCTKCPEPRWA